MKCLRRLLGSRRVLWSLETTYYRNCVSNHTIHTTSFAHGANKFILNPRSLCYLSEEAKGSCDSDSGILETKEKQLEMIEKGDTVNLSELLFTKNRDYLIRYNDPQRVTADQLAGKVVVLYFVREDPHRRRDTSMASLIDVYNDLKPKNCFEVVFVFVDDDGNSPFPSPQKTEPQIFEDIFSLMPWTAIPFSDINLRKYLKRRFGLPKSHWSNYPIGIVVDATGMVLQTSCEQIIDIYGSPAYPFSDERLALLDSEDDIITMQPSLKNLLASPQRDYVISNTGEKVPIHTLEDKLEMLCSPTTVFGRKDGSQVQFSHFAGKRVLIYIESVYWNDSEDVATFKEAKFPKMLKEVKFLKMLKESCRYAMVCIFCNEGYWNKDYQGLLKNSFDAN
ncbi:hypothetical protein POM88_022942 [Heracleum sosnowskyi]|uniref:protein-disulfide reductase n=1 Tax=Heracleum sosnowskyi TaxID=360622 RepID=A0AAD8IG04_9APIA|nr:hypothetical protein POM88_022942 [Heracleum sosnowskyi]